MQDAVSGGEAVVDTRSSSLHSKSRIQPHHVGEPIKARAGGGRIAVVIGDPLRHIAHLGVGFAVFIEEAAIGRKSETDVVDAIKDDVDGIAAEQGCGATIVLHQVVTGFDAFLVIAV